MLNKNSIKNMAYSYGLDCTFIVNIKRLISLLQCSHETILACLDKLNMLKFNYNI